MTDIISAYLPLSVVSEPLQPWLLLGAIIFVSLIAGWLGFGIGMNILIKIVRSEFAQAALARLRNPLRTLFTYLVVKASLPALAFSGTIALWLTHSVNIVLILCFGFMGARLLFLLQEFLLKNYNLSDEDNLRARKAATQFRMLFRIAIVGAWVITFAAVLLTFESIRSLGVSLLASAGITGIIIGFAAQKILGNLLAGIEIAFTQPIKIDDVVIVENEWGRIEEISLTYVIIRIWDQRRLVVPLNYFISKPFENWTRVSADILGTVFLYTDYTVPVDRIREETRRIVEKSDLWDQRVCVVQVTDCKPHVMETRLLVSAKDSSTAWELRCHLREKILHFVQSQYPDVLPRLRATVLQSEERGKTQPESHP